MKTLNKRIMRQQNKNTKSTIKEDVYDLSPRYDSRNSFYGKASVEEKDDGTKILYSYGSKVAMIKDGKAILGLGKNRGYEYLLWAYSPTTLRHVKEFLKQNGFRADSRAQMEKDYGAQVITEKECTKDTTKESCESKKSLKENTPNFDSMKDFPLYVFLTYDEVMYDVQSSYNAERDGDYDEWEEKFLEDNYKNISILDEEEVKELEEKIEKANADIKSTADELIDSGDDEKVQMGWDLEDCLISIKPGYYQGAQLYVKNSKYVPAQYKEMIMKHLEDIAKEFGLTKLKVSYQFSNGETGYSIVESKNKFTKKSFEKKLNESVKILCDLSDYTPWSGAVSVWQQIEDADKVDELDFMLEDTYPEGLTMTELNDLLWFESDYVLESLGIRSDDEDEEDEDSEDDED